MIVVFGSITLDFILPTARLPEPGETLLGRNGYAQAGGKGANQAVAAARAGGRVVMAGAVGSDALAAPALAGLVAAGVDVSRVVRRQAQTGFASVTTDRTGMRRVAVASNANMLASAAQIEAALLTPDTTLLLQTETDPAELCVLVMRARRRGARIILNLSPPAILPAETLRALDWLVVSEGEASWLGHRLATGGNAASLHAALGVGVVCSLATEGAEAVSDSGHCQFPAHKVRAVDTSGAGDVLAGVLAASLDRGMAIGPALRRANAAAALSCTSAVTQDSLPGVAEIDQFLRESSRARVL